MTAQNMDRMDPPQSGVRVRMYRVEGLGDCFLLAFLSNEGSPRYMLIDCGVIIGTPNGANRLRAVANDIKTATDGCIHYLVATHEHWDHLSGFQYARGIFDDMEFKEAWFAWTENPEHPLANKLRKKREIALQALSTVVNQLRGVNNHRADYLERLLGFYGDLAATGLRGTSGQLKYIQEKAVRIRYLRPGESAILPEELSGMSFYVLGPPENERLLSRSAPSGEEGEVYERPEALNAAAGFYAAVLAGEDAQKIPFQIGDLFERSLPFERVDGISINAAANHELFSNFFTQYYGFSDISDEGQGMPWRRIDYDWLGVAENLALHLDNDTNNTSLVLAIKTPARNVLLFPGDAQVGNWLSWHSLSWKDEEGDMITTADLLERTVLYKVGHHGSHNATLRDKGLEMMVSPDLVAMIPVHTEHAEKRNWSMPFPTLLERLSEKTRGRILFSDLGLPDKPNAVHPEEWETFKANVRKDDSPDQLWVEYDVT
jgi:beta-lactamase superfamily II metal-dependent hydrolase